MSFIVCADMECERGTFTYHESGVCITTVAHLERKLFLLSPRFMKLKLITN